MTAILCATPFVSTAVASGLPPQGLYEECEPVNQAQCGSELSQMGGAGFQLALNYSAWYGDAAAVQAYASEAQAAGIKIIWPIDYAAWRDPGTATSLLSTYKMLAPDCGCSNNSSFVQYAINLVRNLPATWGYYVGDELDPSQASADAALASQVRSLDPNHQLLYVGMGSATTTGSNLQPFESIANVVGADIYPIGGGGTAQSVAPVASAVQQLSQQNRTASAMVLQAFDWSEYPATPSSAPTWPTESEMQQMRDEALAINPSMILWYSIYDVLRSDNPAGHWQDLVTAAFAPEPASPAAGSGTQSSSSPGGAIATVASAKHRHHRHRHRHRHRRHHRHRGRGRHRHRRDRHHRTEHRRQPHRAQDLLVPSLETLLVF